MLSPYTVTIYTKQDNPYNVVPEAPIEIRERLANGTSGSLSIIYSDQEGLIPITQTGAKADSNGQFVFYAEAAQYNAVYESQTVPVDVGVTVDTLPSAMINNLSLPYVFDTVADYKAFSTAFPVGKVIKLLDRGAEFTVISGTDTANGYNIIASSAVSQSAVLVIGDETSIEHWGVVVGVNSGPATNAAADYCRSNGTTLKSKSGAIYTTDETLNFRGIKHLEYKSQIIGSSDFVTVLLGGESTNTQQYYNQYVHKANRGGASPAVRLVGSNKNLIAVDEASIFEIYADTDSSTGGTQVYSAYNSISVKSCTTFQINSNPTTDGSSVQWVNENQIYLQYCLYLKVFDNGYSHNSNQFYGGNFEAADSTIEFETGTANTMRGVRGEDALQVIFGANATNNNVITDWFGFQNAPDAAVVLDDGANNCVKNFNDLTNDRITIMSFNGSSLKHAATNEANLLGVADSTVITANTSTNEVTTATFQTFYTTPIIEIFNNAQYFDVEVSPKLSGGIKMLINGWDSNMSPIASTGSDVFFQGATNEVAGFGEDNTTLTNRASQRRIVITNSNAKYIEIVVKGSSAGCTFRRFTVEMVTSAVDGKKAAIASAMIPNII